MDFIAFMLLIFSSIIVWEIVVSYVCYNYSKQLLLSFGLIFTVSSLHFNADFLKTFRKTVSGTSSLQEMIGLRC